jgi:hypothetical protein
MSQTWIDEYLPLPRPEYAKQTEALLTDLLWRSPGSSLSGPTGASYFDALGQLERQAKGLPGMDRLIPLRAGGQTNLVETFPLAYTADTSPLVRTAPGANSQSSSLLDSVLESIVAPRARGATSLTCVPLHPEIVVLQTLHGLVNKERPPQLARSIEVVGWLGGSPALGSVASRFLQAVAQQAAAREGLPGLIDSIVPLIARHVWSQLPGLSKNPNALMPSWQGVAPQPLPTGGSGSALATNRNTPFSWFWDNWLVLCSPANGWYELLPSRRFTDWSLCLLRTGLAFAYLWEAEFFVRVHACLVERANPSGTYPAAQALRSMVNGKTGLATIESPLVPASQKDAWRPLSTLLARGQVARLRFVKYLENNLPFMLPPSGTGLDDVVQDWIASVPSADLPDLAAPLAPEPDTARNQKFFVRYLLQPRSSDDDSADQADFYYLARTNSKNVWFQPGPEWLVVVTGLLGNTPGGRCTLGMLLEGLSRLGLRSERWVLVGMLEEAGLSLDSPDADNALVIRSGF